MIHFGSGRFTMPPPAPPRSSGETTRSMQNDMEIVHRGLDQGTYQGKERADKIEFEVNYGIRQRSPFKKLVTPNKVSRFLSRLGIPSR